MKNSVRAILQLCKMHAVMDFDYVYKKQLLMFQYTR